MPTMIGMLPNSAVLAVEAPDIDTNTTIMKKVLVSATRIEEDIKDVERSIIVVEQQEIATLQPQSVAEALRFQPNITVMGGPRPELQSVNIRVCLTIKYYKPLMV